MVKLSDYVLGRLKEWGGKHIFLVTGGGAMLEYLLKGTLPGIEALG